MHYYEIDAIINEVKLPNGMYFVVDEVYDGNQYFYTARVRKDDDVCNVTKKPNYGWEGRRWIIEANYDESHVLRTLWACFMATMEHELREQFVYKGKLPFGPHFDINDVMAKADEVS